MLSILAASRIADAVERINNGVGAALAQRNTQFERCFGRGRTSERETKRQDIAGFVNNEVSRELESRERSRNSERRQEGKCEETSVYGHDVRPSS